MRPDKDGVLTVVLVKLLYIERSVFKLPLKGDPFLIYPCNSHLKCNDFDNCYVF